MKLLVSLVICGILASAAVAQDICPRIIPRAVWGGFPARHVPIMTIRPAPYLIIHPTHHIIDEWCEVTPTCSAKLRDIQNFQMLANGWPDISYHFVFTAQQVFYTGRGWSRMGENVGAYNNQAINLGFLGMEFTPNPTTLASINQFIDCGIHHGFLDPNVRLIAQCQVTGIVACDTSELYSWINEHPRFEPNPQPF